MDCELHPKDRGYVACFVSSLMSVDEKELASDSSLPDLKVLDCASAWGMVYRYFARRPGRDMS